MSSVYSEFFQLSAHLRPMSGDMKTSALNLDHLGWLLCDGRLLNVSDWQFLYNVIGYQFGSNVSGTQFALPNPSGRVPGFIGAGTGLTVRSLGNSLGEETHTLTIAEMPTHSHTITDPGHNHTFSYVNQPNTTSPAVSLTTTDVADDVNQTQTGNTSNATTGITNNTTGGSNAHNNMQPTLFVGNMFMYSGKPNYGYTPLTIGTPIV